MPKITAPTVAEHREQQREALLSAAAALMEQGTNFTVAEVAKHVGISRSAVYLYYSSSADLIADVLVDELATWADELSAATADVATPVAKIERWIAAVIEYVADGRHALVRSAGSIELPETRRAQVQHMHRELIAPLYSALMQAGVTDAAQQSRYVWGVVDAAIARIEAGQCDAEAELDAVTAFVLRALAL